MILLYRNLLKLAKVGAGASVEGLGRIFREGLVVFTLENLPLLTNMVTDTP